MQITRTASPAFCPLLPSSPSRTASPLPTGPAELGPCRPHSAPNVAVSPAASSRPQLPLCTQFFLVPPKDPGTHRLLRRYLVDLEQRRAALEVREHERLQQDAPLRTRLEAAGQSFRCALAQLDVGAPSRLLVIGHTSLTSESACGVAVVGRQGGRDAARMEHLAACPEALLGQDPALRGMGRTLVAACVRLSTMTGHDGRLEAERPPEQATGFLAACHFVPDGEARWALAGPGLLALKGEVNPRLPQ